MGVPTRLAIALDFSDLKRAQNLVQELAGLPLVYKVGSELFMAAGPQLIRELKQKNLSVFLDLKFHDIPNTVVQAVSVAASYGVDFLTVHLSGGREMIQAAQNKILELQKTSQKRPVLLGVSVLTSFGDVTWAEVSEAVGLGSKTPDQSVQALVNRGAEWGVDGVVCSGLELKSIRQSHPQLITVVPGVRQKGSHTQSDQVRITTPYDAAQEGASMIVVGRPITESQNPKQVVQSILSELQEGSHASRT